MFGNAPRAMWAKWSPPDEENRIPLACRALLASPLNGKTVLFETGIGAFFEPKLRERYGVQEIAARAARLAARRRLRPRGHRRRRAEPPALRPCRRPAGAVARRAGRRNCCFPNATYRGQRRHWQRALHPHPRDRASFIPELPGLLEASGRLEIVDGDVFDDARPQRALQLQRRPHAGADAGGDRRARKSSTARRMAAWCSAPT